MSKRFEKFMFVRLTEGVEWLRGMTSSEIVAFFFLASIAKKSGYVTLPQTARDKLLLTLGVGKTALSLILSSLEKKDRIKRLRVNEYVVNPKFLFKGSSRDLWVRERVYEDAKTTLAVMSENGMSFDEVVSALVQEHWDKNGEEGE